MTTYISILRGINVSGQKLIKMDALRKSYEALGFRSIKTYVQSGNIIFKTSEGNIDSLEQAISRIIEKDFGFKVPVIVLSLNDLKQIIGKNPFLHDPDKDRAFLHVTFLSSTPAEYDRNAIEEKKQNGEDIAFSDRAIYLYCPNGYGQTKLTNNLLESKLKVGATTRNWKTTNEIGRIAEEME